MLKTPSSVFWLTTNNVNLKLSTFIIYFNTTQSGSRNSILDYNHETNAVTCFACRKFSGSSPLCVTDWKNATSFRIYIWVLRLQMMQSLQSISTQSSRGLSKVSAYWVVSLSSIQYLGWKPSSILSTNEQTVKWPELSSTNQMPTYFCSANQSPRSETSRRPSANLTTKIFQAYFHIFGDQKLSKLLTFQCISKWKNLPVFVISGLCWCQGLYLWISWHLVIQL